MTNLKEIAKELKEFLQCNCNCELHTQAGPEPDTGHSFVCRIHTAALRIYKLDNVKQIIKILKTKQTTITRQVR